MRPSLTHAAKRKPRRLDLFHLLVIDDDEVDRRAIKRALGAVDPRVHITPCSNLTTARELLSSFRFDCLLLDLQLPDGNGLDFLGQIGDVQPSPAVVVLTGSDDRQIAETALQRGAQDSLLKSQLDGPVLLRSLCYAREVKRTEALRAQTHHAAPTAARKPWSAGLTHHAIDNPLQALLANLDFAQCDLDIVAEQTPLLAPRAREALQRIRGALGDSQKRGDGIRSLIQSLQNLSS